jgi:hypothetical protein
LAIVRKYTTYEEIDDQDTKKNKPEASTKKGNTSKGYAKMKEISHVARRTKSSKRKMKFQQEEEIKLEPESFTSKQKIIGFDRVYTRMRAKQKIELKEVKYEVEINGTPVEESPQEK